eukprot:TRINITY_DN3339_c0_g1_i2.p1 TRINITY_DN3339_c0_g1~~TRINITY_DN3339_c0_g1_i2.p1  ORF type:complete len:422 (+),score=89.14 TRINITY_DN3339_c0_g1_i2:91-1356(+)
MDVLGLDNWLVKACGGVGIRAPTPIQSLAIPAILNSKNVCGRAQTGSGKTAAFALPILQKLAKDPYGIFAIVLTPARELAIQITEQFQIFGASCGLEVCTAIGGLDFVKQGIEISSRPHVVVATPGRLAELLRSRSGESLTTDLAFLVFDEADRLLSKDFAENINDIMQSIQTSNYQTLLFSATLDAELLLDRELFPFVPTEFQFLSVSDSCTSTADDVTQRYVFMPLNVKDSCLVRILKFEEMYAKKETSIIVFVSSKKTCEVISALLTEMSVENVALHSGISQARRLASLGKFKSRVVRILVATDVASRGLDIPSVDLVVNYDLPFSPKDYVHRIGRTGRAGKRGDSITLVSQFDIGELLEIEKLSGKKMVELKLKDEDLATLMREVNPAKRIALIRLEEYLDKKKELRRKEQNKRRTT